MTAKEANDLVIGYHTPKGKIFRLKLWWYCGWLNQKIARLASCGYTNADIEFPSQNDYLLYGSAMERTYKENGYKTRKIDIMKTLYVEWKGADDD